MFFFCYINLPGRDDQILLSGILSYLVKNMLERSSHLPVWRTDGVIITILLHVGLVEFLYYWFHRALHHHHLYSRYTILTTIPQLSQSLSLVRPIIFLLVLFRLSFVSKWWNLSIISTYPQMHAINRWDLDFQIKKLDVIFYYTINLLSQIINTRRWKIIQYFGSNAPSFHIHGGFYHEFN